MLKNSEYKGARNQHSLEALEQELADLENQTRQSQEEAQAAVEARVVELEKEVPAEVREDKAPETPEEKTFKQRYGDLRRHSQKREQELLDEINGLKQAPTSAAVAPKTEEEVEAWMNKYPDVAGIVLKLVDRTQGTKTTDLEQRLRMIEQKEEEVKKKTALSELKGYHPDLDSLMQDTSPLHTWAEAQPEWLQSLLYEGTNPKDVARVISMYKLENGIKDKPVKSDTEKAAGTVARPSGAKPAETSGKRVFRESEIEAMSDKDFAKYEAEIMDAQRNGRVVRDRLGAAY